MEQQHEPRRGSDIIRFFIPLALASTVLSGLVYAAVQQNYRMTANDPQIQVAEDIAEVVSQGAPAAQVVPNSLDTNLAKSLSVFVMIFDDSGKLTASTGQLNGKAPVPPNGVFDVTKRKGQDRFTWQPQKGVRIAAVTTRFTGKESGYILAGRNISEVEKREQQLTFMVLAGWLASLLLPLLWMLFAGRKGRAAAPAPAHEAHHPEAHHPGHEHEHHHAS